MKTGQGRIGFQNMLAVVQLAEEFGILLCNNSAQSPMPHSDSISQFVITLIGCYSLLNHQANLLS